MGFALSAAITPPIADSFGRRIPYRVSLIVQAICYILIILSKNVYLTIGLYGIVGLCSAGFKAVGPMYMNEFVPFKN